MNKIIKCETAEVESTDTYLNAIFMSLNVETDMTSDFMSKVRDAFISQKMISPKNTSLLLITIIGGFSAAKFSSAWKDLVTSDEVLSVLMKEMIKADVIQGESEGQIISSSSLI